MEKPKVSKEARLVLFLKESEGVKNYAQLKELYIKKFKLAERSNDVNIRVIERLLGTYAKYSAEKKAEKVTKLKEYLATQKIDYTEIVARAAEVKEMSKRSNRLKVKAEF